MHWNTYYLAPNHTQWQGRTDLPPASAFFQIIQPINLLEQPHVEPHHPTFALVGFCCEEGVRRNFGRIGAAEGPKAIRQALGRLPIARKEFICLDAGDIICMDNNLEAAQQALGEVVTLLLNQQITPIILGGGHEMAWGHYQGIQQAYPTQALGIINFDAHLDMRPLLPNQQGSSGTPFLQIAEAHRQTHRHLDYNCVGVQHASNISQVVNTALSYHTQMMWADDLHQGQIQKSNDFIDRIIDENEMIYSSICLNVFASAFAPGVSAIQPLGLFPWHIIPLIRQLALSGKVISYDIAELAPRYDIDQRTAKLAAHLIYEIIHHHHLFA